MTVWFTAWPAGARFSRTKVANLILIARAPAGPAHVRGDDDALAAARDAEAGRAAGGLANTEDSGIISTPGVGLDHPTNSRGGGASSPAEAPRPDRPGEGR